MHLKTNLNEKQKNSISVGISLPSKLPSEEFLARGQKGYRGGQKGGTCYEQKRRKYLQKKRWTVGSQVYPKLWR